VIQNKNFLTHTLLLISLNNTINAINAMNAINVIDAISMAITQFLKQNKLPFIQMYSLLGIVM